MSAWPEAYYVINQISNQFNLSNRVIRLEGKIFVFAPQKSGTREPDITVSGVTYREGSLWFVEKPNTENNQIYALSVYSEQTGHVGWSDFHILSVDVNNIAFTPTSDVLEGITDIGAAINYLADQLGAETGVANATTTSAGIVQIGANITVNNGLISVPNASTSQAGVVQLVDNVDNQSTTLAVTQNAVHDALESKITSAQAQTIATSAANTAISNADFLTTVSVAGQTLNKTNSVISAADLKTNLGLKAAAYKEVAGSLQSSESAKLVTAQLVSDVNNTLTNINSNALILVPSSGWSSEATEINGTSLYYQTINTKTTNSGTSTFKVYNTNPTIGIGVPLNRTPQIPTQSEINAFSLLYAAVASTPSASNGNITFYATETPQTDFYVLVRGVN